MSVVHKDLPASELNGLLQTSCNVTQNNDEVYKDASFIIREEESPI